MMDFSLPRIAAFQRRRRGSPGAGDGRSGGSATINGRHGSLPRTRRRSPWARIATRTALTAAALAALVTIAALAASDDSRAQRVAVVMDASVAHDPGRRAAADQWLRSHGAAGVAPRIADGPTQQLSVTSTLAVRGYDVIVAVGLDGPVAINPVVQRYPELRVVRD
jgi:hypothetical protein